MWYIYSSTPKSTLVKHSHHCPTHSQTPHKHSIPFLFLSHPYSSPIPYHLYIPLLTPIKNPSIHTINNLKISLNTKHNKAQNFCRKFPTHNNAKMKLLLKSLPIIHSKTNQLSHHSFHNLFLSIKRTISNITLNHVITIKSLPTPIYTLSNNPKSHLWHHS